MHTHVCDFGAHKPVLFPIHSGKSGSFFGEIAIMVTNSRRTAMIRAVSFCDVAVLSFARFDKLMEMYPSDAEKVREKAS